MEKKYKVRSNREYRKIYDKGQSKANKHLVVFYKPNGLAYSRIGFTATKKLGNAVIRNKVRRLMKESYYQVQDKVINGYDIVILARVSANSIDYLSMKSAVSHILKISKLRKEGK